jgi:nucleoid-associated protein YgaU
MEELQMRLKKQWMLLVAVLCLVLIVANVFGQEDERKIKMKDYKLQLTEAQTREADATAQIAALQAEIDALNAQINVVQGEIDAEWAAIYALLGTDKAGVEAYRADLNDINGSLDGLGALSAEDLFRQREELEALEARLEEAKTSNIYKLTEMENSVADLEGKIAGLMAKMPANIFDQYTVVNGDHLWKISGKDEIYNDPMQWIRIYCVNKDQIKDADLIFPDQIFNIARGVAENEHLVVKGEDLSAIAGMAKIFNDPTKWAKLYEANKDLVSDPNLIYPYQVLTIPKE